MNKTQLTKNDIKTYYQCECGKISYWYEPRCVRCDSDNIKTVKVIVAENLIQVLTFYEKYRWQSIQLAYDNPEIYKKYQSDWKEETVNKMSDDVEGWFEHWLFKYCFLDGLKI